MATLSTFFLLFIGIQIGTPIGTPIGTLLAILICYVIINTSNSIYFLTLKFHKKINVGLSYYLSNA